MRAIAQLLEKETAMTDDQQKKGKIKRLKQTEGNNESKQIKFNAPTVSIRSLDFAISTAKSLKVVKLCSSFSLNCQKFQAVLHRRVQSSIAYTCKVDRCRFLDLRWQQMNLNILLRHNEVKLIRRYLEERHGFAEIETPILSRSTPEGARDYLVPSRIQPGTFYALPQGPQLFKQMLMVAGFDKYYQIARLRFKRYFTFLGKCFHDEDLRADRQPEFTQLDMEMAFTPLEDMLRLNEDLIGKVFLEIKGVELPNPFPRLTYAEAMNRYGSDRPDTRFDLELKDVSDIFSGSSFRVFSDTLESGGIVKVLCVPTGAKHYSNLALKKGDIYSEAVKSGAKGLPFLKVLDNGKEITVDRLIGYVAHDLGLIDVCRHSILWINDFPSFEWNDSENRLEALHHPFTAPNPEDMNDLASALALAYDLVYNGVEIGGGSLRIYKRDIQQKILEIVGISMEQLVRVFGK
ncbi:hypothetical protein L6164_017584 [Bauhinia variegata]|uniref:Uncharacterized protein n=1 Tax=Bauhinia variegata TaxID=167791 RepID=A0ACB9N882_BAUVA|nr:hypothetical protein L6164_017584 [Bauhinia variegata]